MSSGCVFKNLFTCEKKYNSGAPAVPAVPTEQLRSDVQYTKAMGVGASRLAAQDFNYLAKFMSNNSKAYQLGLECFPNMPGVFGRQYLPYVAVGQLGGPDSVHFLENSAIMNYGLGTQIDTVAHILDTSGYSYGNKHYSTFVDETDVSLGAVQQQAFPYAVYGDISNALASPRTTTTRSAVNGAGCADLPPIVCRCIILDAVKYYTENGTNNYADDAYNDVQEAFGMKYLRPTAMSDPVTPAGTTYAVGINEVAIKGMLSAAGITDPATQIKSGDLLLFHCGYSQFLTPDKNDPNRYAKNAIFNAKHAGLDHDGATYLATLPICGVATDTWGSEALFQGHPGGHDSNDPAHTHDNVSDVHDLLIRYAGLWIFEGFNSTQLCADGKTEGLLIVGAPRTPTAEGMINPIMFA